MKKKYGDEEESHTGREGEIDRGRDRKREVGEKQNRIRQSTSAPNRLDVSLFCKLDSRIELCDKAEQRTRAKIKGLILQQCSVRDEAVRPSDILSARMAQWLSRSQTA
mmetsp:Transcript_41665/g.82229  ORF Transcript_41665/g.82229 Transcript_41665/m.82229 type:complete len:108 (-) Transcript_41665:1326-1649(-)